VEDPGFGVHYATYLVFDFHSQGTEGAEVFEGFYRKYLDKKMPSLKEYFPEIPSDPSGRFSPRSFEEVRCLFYSSFVL